jgi:hypothetical protein
LDVYAKAGITGVDANNLDEINSVLNSAAVDSTATNSVAKVQAIVDAYNKVLASANGTDGDATNAVSASEFTVLGVTGVDSATAALLSDVVDSKNSGDVDTVAELQALADAAKAAITYTAAHSQTAPTLAQINALVAGQTPGGSAVPAVTGDNAAAVQAAIAAANADGTAVTTQAELANIVKAAVSAYETAIAKIAAYAAAATDVPAAADYAAAGITGVTGAVGNPASGNVDAINSAIKAQAGVDATDGNTDERLHRHPVRSQWQCERSQPQQQPECSAVRRDWCQHWGSSHRCRKLGVAQQHRRREDDDRCGHHRRNQHLGQLGQRHPNAGGRRHTHASTHRS